MATYVYRCDQDETEIEVIHGMTENPAVTCPKCAGAMHRKPQVFRFYMNPQLLLLDKLGERFSEVRKEKKYGIKRTHARGEPI